MAAYGYHDSGLDGNTQLNRDDFADDGPYAGQPSRAHRTSKLDGSQFNTYYVASLHLATSAPTRFHGDAQPVPPYAMPHKPRDITSQAQQGVQQTAGFRPEATNSGESNEGSDANTASSTPSWETFDFDECLKEMSDATGAGLLLPSLNTLHGQDALSIWNNGLSNCGVGGGMDSNDTQASSMQLTSEHATNQPTSIPYAAGHCGSFGAGHTTGPNSNDNTFPVNDRKTATKKKSKAVEAEGVPRPTKKCKTSTTKASTVEPTTPFDLDKIPSAESLAARDAATFPADEEFPIYFKSPGDAREFAVRRVKVSLEDDDVKEVKHNEEHWVREIMRVVAIKTFAAPPARRVVNRSRGKETRPLTEDEKLKWQRWQKSHADEVSTNLKFEDTKVKVAARAWLLLEEVLTVYGSGYQLTTLGGDTNLKCSERLMAMIEAMEKYALIRMDFMDDLKRHEFAADPKEFAKRKVNNFWVNRAKDKKDIEDNDGAGDGKNDEGIQAALKRHYSKAELKAKKDADAKAKREAEKESKLPVKSVRKTNKRSGLVSTPQVGPQDNLPAALLATSSQDVTFQPGTTIEHTNLGSNDQTPQFVPSVSMTYDTNNGYLDVPGFSHHNNNFGGMVGFPNPAAPVTQPGSLKASFGGAGDVPTHEGNGYGPGYNHNTGDNPNFSDAAAPMAPPYSLNASTMHANGITSYGGNGFSHNFGGTPTSPTQGAKRMPPNAGFEGVNDLPTHCDYGYGPGYNFNNGGTPAYPMPTVTMMPPSSFSAAPTAPPSQVHSTNATGLQGNHGMPGQGHHASGYGYGYGHGQANNTGGGPVFSGHAAPAAQIKGLTAAGKKLAGRKRRAGDTGSETQGVEQTKKTKRAKRG